MKPLPVRGWTLPALMFFAYLATPLSAVDVTHSTIVSGLNRPVYVTGAPGVDDHLFILEKRGVIRVLDTTTNTLEPNMMDINSIVVNLTFGDQDERGLLGLAFHPNYASNRFFYVYYISNLGSSVVARYTANVDLLTANTTTALILKTFAQPEINHNGGCLQFGADGKLYVATGDGGGAADQHGAIGNGQNLTNLLGKMLRLDVDIASPYIPADNPMIPGALDEIWQYGLRHPWRFSFDRQNGDMWVGDVGQDAREEVNHVLGSSTGGENYGWRCMEGVNCFITPSGVNCTCNGVNLTDPVYDYTQSFGRCTVVGGYVYRGVEIPGENGNYFFGDYCTGEMFSFDPANPGGTDVERIDLPGGTANRITSFGEDNDGEIYMVTGVGVVNGAIRRIVPTCNTAGDINADCSTDLVDASILVDVLLGIDPGDAALTHRCDINDDGERDGLDIAAWVDEI